MGCQSGHSARSVAGIRVRSEPSLVMETRDAMTLAIETGSDRMRRRINKNLKHEQILEASATLAQAGLEGVKFYGMVGLPDETDEDVEQLASLLKEVRKQNPKLKVHLGCSSFVPKAGTPFQWQPNPSAALTISSRAGM